MSDKEQYKIGDILTYRKAVKLKIVGSRFVPTDPRSCDGCFFRGNGCSYDIFITEAIPPCHEPMNGYPSIIFQQATNFRNSSDN